MSRHARPVWLVRKPIAKHRLELCARPSTAWPKHLCMAWRLLRFDLGMSDEIASRLVIESVTAAYKCALQVNDQSRHAAHALSITQLAKAFARIANCAKRGSPRLRRNLDQAIVPIARQTPVDLEVVEAILDAANAQLAKHNEEPAKTALDALGVRDDGEVQRFAMKVEIAGLPSASVLRLTAVVSEVAKNGGADLTTARVFAMMASILQSDLKKVDSKITKPIIDYVAAVAALWEATGLRPGRANREDDRDYKSRFQHFTDLVLTSIIEPGARRHDGDRDTDLQAIRKVHDSLVAEDRKGVGFGKRRSDREWLVNEYHIRQALPLASQKSALETP